MDVLTQPDKSTTCSLAISSCTMIIDLLFHLTNYLSASFLAAPNRRESFLLEPISDTPSGQLLRSNKGNVIWGKPATVAKHVCFMTLARNDLASRIERPFSGTISCTVGIMMNLSFDSKLFIFSIK